MKLHLEGVGDRSYTVQAYTPVSITIRGQVYRGGLLLAPDWLYAPWGPTAFAALQAEDFAPVAARQPEVFLLGTGSRQRFPAISLLRDLAALGLRPEVMDTGAACRTYNVLAAEDRNVAAALLIGAPE